MQEPYQWDIEIFRGRDFEERIEMQNVDGTPAVLTSWAVKSQIRMLPKQSAPLVEEFTAAIVPTFNVLILTKTEVTLVLTALQTSTLVAGIRYYDIILTDADTKIRTYVQGTVTVRDTVTADD